MPAATHLCAVCGLQISQERLDAIPDAKMCATCQKQKIEAYEREILEQDKRQQTWNRVVEAALKKVLDSISAEQPRVQQFGSFGAIGIHPRHLATWYLFTTDADWREAERNGLLDVIRARTLAELEKGGYPAEVLPEITVSFTSHETIQREAGGNYREYFK